MHVLRAITYLERRLGNLTLLAIALYLLADRIMDYVRYHHLIVFRVSDELRIHSVAALYLCFGLAGLLPKHWTTARRSLWLLGAIIGLVWCSMLLRFMYQGLL